MNDLDRRLHAYRSDLADMQLKEQVEAERFVAGKPACIVRAIADLRRHPAADAPLDSQAFRGEPVTVFETTPEGWSWVQLGGDRYVGWMASEALAPPAAELTHRVCVPRTLVFSGPDIKSPLMDILPIGARVSVISTASDHNADYGRIAPAGAVVMQHLMPVDRPFSDYVATAEMLTGTPYLWGGRSAFGLDCSALVQIAMGMAGHMVPRDSDMQEDAIGTPLDLSAGLPALQRGDLVFWKGHVGIMQDSEMLLHANAHHMAVASEPLAEAIARLDAAGYQVTGVRRPENTVIGLTGQ